MIMNCQFVVLILTVKKDNFYIYLVNYWGGCDAYGKRAPSITNLTIHCVALEATLLTEIMMCGGVRITAH